MTDAYVRAKKRQYVANLFAHFAPYLLRQETAMLWRHLEPVIMEVLGATSMARLYRQVEEVENTLAGRKQVLRLLAQAVAVPQPPRSQTRSPFAHNMQVLARLLRLSEVESAVLEFLLIARFGDSLCDCLQSLDNLSYAAFVMAVARLTGLRLQQVNAALAPTATLRTCGLVTIGRERDRSLPYLYELAPQLVQAIHGPRLTAETLVSAFCQKSPAAVVAGDDFPTYQMEIKDMTRLLRPALRRGQPGVNLLLYGPPGVGKTTLARLLAAQAEAQLYEVPCGDEDNGTPASIHDRLAALTVAHRVLQRHHGVVLLLDDADDLLHPGPGLLSSDSSAPPSKVWLNRLLETNPVPTLWIVNHEAGIDEAYKRRFLTSLHFASPDAPTRVRQWQAVLRRQQLSAYFSQETLDALAQRYAVSVGLIDTALKAARLVHGNAPLELSTVERCLQRAMALRDGTSPLPCMPQPDQEVYDVALLNTSPAVDEIARGVQRFVALPVAARPTPSLCLLFYGPPGTGKSAYAQQLARLVQRPLLRKRSSDVLSMWVGGTEHNLARAFQQAQQTQAILFLDECDSFLQQRASARQSWEVTQVNELLTQIDAFTGGMLIMATNMPDILDPASLRRFVKVRFSPLTLAQRVQAFQRYFAPLLPDGVPDTASLAQALRDLHDLTLGDFRLVRQQQLFTAGPWTVAGLVQQLSAELQHRRQKAAIGFGHA